MGRGWAGRGGPRPILSRPGPSRPLASAGRDWRGQSGQDKTCPDGAGRDGTGLDGTGQDRPRPVLFRSVPSRPVGRRAPRPVPLHPTAPAGGDWWGQTGQAMSGWDGTGRDGTGRREGTGRVPSHPVLFRPFGRRASPPVPSRFVPPRPFRRHPRSRPVPSRCPAGSRPWSAREGKRRGERTCGVRESVFHNCRGTRFPTRISAHTSGAKKERGLGLRVGFGVKLGASVGLDCESDFDSSLGPLRDGIGGGSRDKTCRDGKGRNRAGRHATGGDRARWDGTGWDGAGPVLFRPVPSRTVGRRAPRPVPSHPIPIGESLAGGAGPLQTGRQVALGSPAGEGAGCQTLGHEFWTPCTRFWEKTMPRFRAPKLDRSDILCYTRRRKPGTIFE